MADDSGIAEDPDEGIVIPAREVRAALGIVEGILAALSTTDGLASALAENLPPLSASARLPEVGQVHDADSLELHLLRTAARLAPYVPGAAGMNLVTSASRGAEDAMPWRRATRALALEGDDLAAAAVWWNDVSALEVATHLEVLDRAPDERPLQRYLANNPLLLVQHLGGGHGRWVLSQKRLGSEYVPDFVIGERSSIGFEWYFVELQSPRARLFVPSSGRLSQQFDEGIRQIQEWRRWLEDNRDYARRPRSRNGLGLTDVSARDPGLLIIGREADLGDADRQRRRQLGQDLNILIHTYDWIARQAGARVQALTRNQPGADQHV
jgi:antiviral defense system Shedu protein SduA